jgi:hypothetical protein
MKQVSVLHLCAIGAVFLTLTACASVPAPSPFPPLEAYSHAEKAQVMRARTTGLRTLAAVLTMAFSSGERQGTFEMIVNYDASGQMRFTAFKDLGLSTRPIFDLVFARQQYYLELHDEARKRRRQGHLSQFVQDNPEFRAFLIAGEAFFLPGFDGSGHLPVFTDAAASRFTTRLKSGATAQWFARPDTLEITAARLQWNGGPEPVALRLEYSHYQQIEMYYIPGRVTLTDPQLGFTTQALVKQVDINVPLVEGTFDVPAPAREQVPIPGTSRAVWRLASLAPAAHYETL